MRWGELGWGLVLAGLPWSHLLARPHLDIWHGQTLWAQAGGLLVFTLALGQPSQSLPANRPLAGFLLWVGSLTLWLWVTAITLHHVYPLAMLQGIGHLTILLFWYLSAMSLWTSAMLERFLRLLRWVGMSLLVYGGLQLLNLDQFFNPLDPGRPHDQLVGTVGNPSHFAAQLAMLLPLYLWAPTRWERWMTVPCLGLLAMTDSIGGQGAAVAVLGWWGWQQFKGRRRWLVLGGMSLLGLLGIGWCVWAQPNGLNPYGRWQAWQEFYKLFVHQPITGFGSGYIMELSRVVNDTNTPINHWRHVHNEYFQIAIEYGLIGLGLVGWMVIDLIRRTFCLHPSSLLLTCWGVLIAFGLNSLVNFPAHLWGVGFLALIAYCGLQVLIREESA